MDFLRAAARHRPARRVVEGQTALVRLDDLPDKLSVHFPDLACCVAHPDELYRLIFAGESVQTERCRVLFGFYARRRVRRARSRSLLGRRTSVSISPPGPPSTS